MPLSRLSVADVARQAQRCGLVARISDSTVWRWLHEDAIRPWQHRCWIFPRDPQFQAKAARILDLYARSWQGRELREDEFVVSTDEKTSIQARLRMHRALRLVRASPMRVEQRICTRGRLGVPGRTGRTPGEGVRALRGQHWHCALRAAGRPSDGPAALQRSAHGVLDHGQRIVASRREFGTPV